MHRAVIVASLLVAGCRAELIGGDRDKLIDAPPGSLDAPTSTDAPSIDGAIDARLCAGGDARMTSPSDGSCVVFFQAAKTWADAQAACVAFGAHLAIIDDAPTDQVARTLAGTLDVFIGLSDSATEMTFRWVDDTPLVYENWRLGEPNDGNGNFAEDCAIINGVRGGEWDDRPCAPDPLTTAVGQYPYLCQF